MEDTKKVYRGDIWFVDLRDFSIKNHLGLIVSNWKSNARETHDSVTIALITSQFKSYIKSHVVLEGYGLDKKSQITLEDIHTVKKSKLLYKIGHVDNLKMLEVDEKLREHLQLQDKCNNLEALDLENLFIENNSKVQNEKVKLEKLKSELFFSYSNQQYKECLELSNKLSEVAYHAKTQEKNKYLWYALYVKAVSNLKLGNINEAFVDAQESLCFIIKPQTYNQDYSLTLWLIARCCEELKNYNKAILIYKSLIKYYKTNFDSFMRIACCFNLAQIYKNARAMNKIVLILKASRCTNINFYNTKKHKAELLKEMQKELDAMKYI